MVSWSHRRGSVHEKILKAITNITLLESTPSTNDSVENVTNGSDVDVNSQLQQSRLQHQHAYQLDRTDSRRSNPMSVLSDDANQSVGDAHENSRRRRTSGREYEIDETEDEAKDEHSSVHKDLLLAVCNEDTSPFVGKWTTLSLDKKMNRLINTVTTVFRIIDKDDDGVLSGKDVEYLAAWFIVYSRGADVQLAGPEMEEVMDYLLRVLDPRQKNVVEFETFFHWFESNIDLDNTTVLQKQLLTSFDPVTLQFMVEKKDTDGADGKASEALNKDLMKVQKALKKSAKKKIERLSMRNSLRR